MKIEEKQEIIERLRSWLGKVYSAYTLEQFDCLREKVVSFYQFVDGLGYDLTESVFPEKCDELLMKGVLEK